MPSGVAWKPRMEYETATRLAWAGAGGVTFWHGIAGRGDNVIGHVGIPSPRPT